MGRVLQHYVALRRLRSCLRSGTQGNGEDGSREDEPMDTSLPLPVSGTPDVSQSTDHYGSFVSAFRAVLRTQARLSLVLASKALRAD